MDAQFLDSELTEKRKSKNRSDDRIFVLEPIKGKFTLSAAGTMDKGLFEGENNLHAVSNEYGNWYVKFDRGLVPVPLRQQWTNFNKLEKFVREYFLKRNVEVVEIID